MIWVSPQLKDVIVKLNFPSLATWFNFGVVAVVLELLVVGFVLLVLAVLAVELFVLPFLPLLAAPIIINKTSSAITVVHTL